MEVNRSWAEKHDTSQKQEIWARAFGDGLNCAKGHMIILHEHSSHSLLFSSIIVSDSHVFRCSSLSFRKNRHLSSSELLTRLTLLFWWKFTLLKLHALNQSAHHWFVITHIVLFVANSSTLICPFLFLPCQCHRLLSAVDLSVLSASRAKSLLPLGWETVVSTV